MDWLVSNFLLLHYNSLSCWLVLAALKKVCFAYVNASVVANRIQSQIRFVGYDKEYLIKCQLTALIFTVYLFLCS
jgi:hypothetical protein